MKIHKPYFHFILIFTIFLLSVLGQISQISGESSTITQDEKRIYEPVVEVLDLAQNGTLATPYIVNLTKSFLFVQRMIWHLHFATNTIDFNNFGDEGALANGINVLYNGISLLDNVNITSNGHFAHESYDLTIFSDGKNPKGNMLTSRLTFTRFSPSGLYINNERALQFYIQDDMTGLTSISQINVTIQGLKRVNNDLIEPIDLFYPNVINPIVITDLYIGIDYQVRVNTSSGRTDKWVNFTATSDNIRIDLYLKDLDDDDQILFIYLYEEGKYLDQISTPIQTQSLDFLGAIFKFIPYAGVLIILIIFISLILGESKRRFF